MKKVFGLATALAAGVAIALPASALANQQFTTCYTGVNQVCAASFTVNYGSFTVISDRVTSAGKSADVTYNGFCNAASCDESLRLEPPANGRVTGVSASGNDVRNLTTL